MRLGETRHGPRAPDARQLGKEGALTSTGEPTRSTSKEMRSSPVRMPVTVTGAVGTRGAEAAWLSGTRGHWEGPPAARGTSQRAGSSYQSTAIFSHGFDPLGSPVTTAGRLVIGATSAEP